MLYNREEGEMKNCPHTQQARNFWADNLLEGIVGKRSTPGHVGSLDLSGMEDICQSLAPGETWGILGERGLRTSLFNLTKGVEAV